MAPNTMGDPPERDSILRRDDATGRLLDQGAIEGDFEDVEIEYPSAEPPDPDGGEFGIG
jgi:hypothetical protein